MDATPPVQPSAIAIPLAEARPWSRLAWVSLGLGLLPCGIFGIPAWICGFVARRRIRKSGGALRGGALALAGEILGVVWIVLTLVAIAAPFVIQLKSEMDPEPTRQRIEHSQRLVQRFIKGHAGHLPAANWKDLLNAEAEEAGSPMSEGFGGFGDARPVGINLGVAGLPLLDVREPSRTVLFFEIDPGGWNGSGGKNTFRSPGARRPRVVGFVDGSVRLIGMADVEGLKWEP